MMFLLFKPSAIRKHSSSVLVRLARFYYISVSSMTSRHEGKTFKSWIDSKLYVNLNEFKGSQSEFLSLFLNLI